MCTWDKDAPADAKFVNLSEAKNDFLDEQRAITHEGMMWYWPSWDITVLNNVTQVS